MKKFIVVLLSLPIVLSALFGLAIFIVLQQGLASRSELAFLIDLGQRDGPGAVVAVIKTQLYGVDPTAAADPSYGREQVEGRGHAPWVLRGNLDGRPRMLAASPRKAASKQPTSANWLRPKTPLRCVRKSKRESKALADRWGH